MLSEPFCKCSAWFPSILFFTVHPSTLVPVDHSTLLQYGFLVFRVYQEVPDGIASSEIHFYPMFPADVLAAFAHALYVSDHYVGLLLLVLLFLLIPCLFFFLFCLMLTLFKAHAGYLHLLKALLRWSSSSCKRWWLEQTVLALFDGIDNTELCRQVIVTVPV